MASGAKNKLSRGIVWVILVLLIVGLAGFGATSFGGSVRAIGEVGDTTISTDRYARAVQQEIRSFEAQTGERMTFAEAQRLGLDQVALQRLVALTALEDEAAALGISVGDAAIRDRILAIEAFRGLDGQFDRARYEEALDRIGQTPEGFEAELRDESARALLQGALVAAIAPPDVLAETLFDFAREERDATLLILTRDNLEEPVGAPDDGDLATFHEENADLFTLPERKRITYAWARPEDVALDMEVADETIETLYDERRDLYDLPERRLVERVVFADAAAAEAARAAIADGTSDFDAIIVDRGLTAADTDLGEVTAGEVPDAVFAVEDPGVVGPVETGLGPALFRVNAILAPQNTPLEEVEDELRAEAAEGRARRAIEAELEVVEDLLAGGATLEEVADETLLTRGEILWAPGMASTEGSDIDAYEAFREAAASAEEGDFPEAEFLADGGLFALRVDEVLAPQLQPLGEVRGDVEAAWRAAEEIARLDEMAEGIAAAVRDGASLEDRPGTLRTETGLLRDGFLENLPDAVTPAVFDQGEGALQVVAGPEQVVVVRTDAVRAPDGDTDEARRIKEAVARQAGQGMAEDIIGAVTDALEARKGLSLDAAAIRAVNAQLQ